MGADETIILDYIHAMEERANGHPGLCAAAKSVRAALQTGGAPAAAQEIVRHLNSNDDDYQITVDDWFHAQRLRVARREELGLRLLRVSTYTVRHHASFDEYTDDAHDGDVHIERVMGLDEDKWGIRVGHGPARLSREAIEWRKRNRGAPIRMLWDHRNDASPERREIRQMFEHPSSPSNRPDGWNEDHQFTLTEACYVCGAARP